MLEIMNLIMDNLDRINDLNTARRALAGCGTNTAALGFGGFTTAATAVNESWNGSTWTELGDLNTARSLLGGAGTNTAALAFGGNSTSATVKQKLGMDQLGQN
jgi:hypothetical protein